MNPLPGIPLVESPLFEGLIDTLPPAVATVARSLFEDGYAIIDFPEEDFDHIAGGVIRDLEPRYDWKAWRKKKLADPRQPAGGMRLQDGAGQSASVLKIACNKRIIDLLSTLYGRRAFPFQTLNFPVGSEQHFHTDTLHFSSIPEKFMCGVWVALEDVGPTQGPLIYYPKSHKLPVYYNEHYGNYQADPTLRLQDEYEAAWESLVSALGLEKKVFHPRKGQALIWAANLLHGGADHLDANKTRWSQVTHYYFHDCAYIAPVHSDALLGRIAFKNVVDLTSNEKVNHSYIGNKVPPELTGPIRSGRSLPDDFDPALYLRLHADVRAAGVNPADHYLRWGIAEGRAYK